MAESATRSEVTPFSPKPVKTSVVLGADFHRQAWRAKPAAGGDDALLAEVLGSEAAERLDLFDRAQLACVIRTARESPTLSEAGRRLFAVSRAGRKVTNDADRLRKYLVRFGLTWEACRGQPRK